MVLGVLVIPVGLVGLVGLEGLIGLLSDVCVSSQGFLVRRLLAH